MASQDYNLSTVGSRLPRVDALGKVTGETRFATDLYMSGMLFGASKLSSLPHAKIKAIHTAKAKELKGVRAVLTASDIPGKNQVGCVIKDQPLLATDKVRFVGDTVALVAADSPEIAYHAIKLIEVDYEELPPILNSQNAIEEGTSLIHDDKAGNICTRLKIRKGNIDEGFQQAKMEIEETFSTTREEHFYLEPMAAVAFPEGNGGVAIYGSLQCPFYIQKAASEILGLSMNRIRVVQTPTGGAFGGKEDTPSELYVRLALLALATGKPVKLLLSRAEDVITTSKRHPMKIKVKLGATRDGKLTAAEIFILADCGAYASLSPVVLFRATAHAAGPYRIPNVKVDTIGAYTNHQPSGAYRGFGQPQVVIAFEGAMDKLAQRLRMDPLDLRLANILESGDQTCTDALLEQCDDLKKTLLVASESAGWREKIRKNTRAYDGHYLRGIGIATIHYGNSLGAKGWSLDKAGALLQVLADGSISLAVGNTDMGQGSNTVLTQIAADAMGVSPEVVSILDVDTTRVPDSGPTVASRATALSGNAIIDAASKVKSSMAAVAAQAFEEPVTQIRFEKDSVVSANGKSMSFKDLAHLAYMKNVHLAAEGWWFAPLSTFDENGLGSAYYDYSYATQIAEVSVDVVTGIVRVNKVTAAHAIGRVVNPMAAEGQVEGGVVQAIGYVLTEDLKDYNGYIQAGHFSTYILPTALDAPEIKVHFVEEPSVHGPFGAKSLGEPALIPAPAAIVNAISNAIGWRMTELPVSAEKIKLTLEAAKKDTIRLDAMNP